MASREYAALMEAFKDFRADTIILLSDGAPRKRGQEVSDLIPQILELVRNQNYLRKLKIFTFGFEGEGEWPPGSRYGRQPHDDPALLVSFLTDLAKEHGGKYTPID